MLAILVMMLSPSPDQKFTLNRSRQQSKVLLLKFLTCSGFHLEYLAVALLLLAVTADMFLG